MFSGIVRDFRFRCPSPARATGPPCGRDRRRGERAPERGRSPLRKPADARRGLGPDAERAGTPRHRVRESAASADRSGTGAGGARGARGAEPPRSPGAGTGPPAQRSGLPGAGRRRASGQRQPEDRGRPRRAQAERAQRGGAPAGRPRHIRNPPGLHADTLDLQARRPRHLRNPPGLHGDTRDLQARRPRLFRGRASRPSRAPQASVPTGVDLHSAMSTYGEDLFGVVWTSGLRADYA